jgi:hypothetical protein
VLALLAALVFGLVWLLISFNRFADAHTRNMCSAYGTHEGACDKADSLGYRLTCGT